MTKSFKKELKFGKNYEAVYYFSIVTVTNYLKLGGLIQQIFYSLQL